MKNNKSLARIFIVNYISSFIVLILGLFIFVILVFLQFYFKFPVLEKRMQNNNVFFVQKYDDIDKDGILKNDGWIEKIQNNKIQEIIGEKKDSINEYSLENLLNNEDISMKYDVRVYKVNENNTEVLYIVKIPNSNYDLLNVGMLNYLCKFALNSLIAFIIFIGLVMFLMSVISIKVLSKPLRKIHDGISKMTSGSYDVRLNFNTYKEIDEIKSAFNFMVEKLQRAEEDKRASEESKNRMIRDISHDIKTPITSIMGYSKALMEDKTEDEEEKKLFLGYIYNKTLRLNYLVDSLFSFVKLDSPNYKLNKNREDFGDFLRELIALYYGELEEKKFNLVLDIPEKDIYVDFDSKEMERAIGNLIVNAIKYNTTETELKVSLQETKEKIIINIEDNGVGMDDDTINNAFKEFVRGDKARSSKGGSGLGLSITKKIVELHNGEITIESEEKKGTRFEIKLPKNATEIPVW